MKAYVTKYALTRGIQEVEVTHETNYPEMIWINAFEIYHKPFWHETREEAVLHAEKLREAKLKSIEKQVKRIKALKF